MYILHLDLDQRSYVPHPRYRTPVRQLPIPNYERIPKKQPVGKGFRGVFQRCVETTLDPRNWTNISPGPNFRHGFESRKFSPNEPTPCVFGWGPPGWTLSSPNPTLHAMSQQSSPNVVASGFRTGGWQNEFQPGSRVVWGRCFQLFQRFIGNSLIWLDQISEPWTGM